MMEKWAALLNLFQAGVMAYLRTSLDGLVQDSAAILLILLFQFGKACFTDGAALLDPILMPPMVGTKDEGRMQHLNQSNETEGS